MNGTERAQAEAVMCRRRNRVCAPLGAFKTVPRSMSDARKFVSMAAHAIRILGLVMVVIVATTMIPMDVKLNEALISRGENRSLDRDNNAVASLAALL